ncbi:MAG: hypothetical protein AAF098_17390 [Pseudomonadota bacterium]
MEVCLPKRLVDPILGDLQEEYLDQILPELGRFRASIWFWKQVLTTAGLYFWKGRGTNMAYLYGFIFFFIVNAIAMALSGNGAQFLNLPSMVIVVPTAIVLGIAATSSASCRLAFRLTFSGTIGITTDSIHSARRFLHVTGNQCLFLGLIGFLIGSIQMATNIEASAFKEVFGPALSVNFLTLLYGVIFKALFYSAEEKLVNLYLEN